ncbi:DNA-3-methyladenine glycosylase family protein [Yoonia sp. 208BN28-4]|uniref:DNA-3-methyladenine glycosylase family protein n=1 Tax=Yoonia sp. 208BN28-4 TaxID=3126505 RepID=UPI00309DCA8A
MNERIIRGPDCVAEGAVAVAQTDPALAAAIATLQPLPLRLKPDGFPALLQAIVGQQVSVASANAIWTRVAAAGFNDPAMVQAADDSALQAVGLSRPKVRYAKALAAAQLPYDALHDMPSADVIKTLIAVSGIGTWTAEIYAMFSLGRADVFAHGDLALQEAARMIYKLETRPSEKDMRQMALRWSPWRAVAARGLWAYYAAQKRREGVA